MAPLCVGGRTMADSGDTSFAQLTPVMVASLSNVKSISTGQKHTCAARTMAPLCVGAIMLMANLVTALPLPDCTSNGCPKQRQIHKCWLKSFMCCFRQRLVACWDQTVMVDLAMEPLLTAQYLLQLVALRQIYKCWYKSFMCCFNNGSAMCWGSNSNNRLGDGTTTDSSIPVTVSLTNVKSISAGQKHTCTALDNGSTCVGDITAVVRLAMAPR